MATMLLSACSSPPNPSFPLSTSEAEAARRLGLSFGLRFADGAHQ
jgi:hypothetical protein